MKTISVGGIVRRKRRTKRRAWRHVLPFAVLFLAMCPAGCGVMTGKEKSKENVPQAGPDGPYAEDERLEAAECRTYDSDRDDIPAEGFLCDPYMWVMEPYDEKEIAESTHARFDDKGRMIYMLGYTPAILEKPGYCEEQIFERDDAAHTCRHIYYKANSSLYESGYYVSFRYMFDVCHYRFAEDGRLLSRLDYSRNVGSDLFGYSDELFFDRGYQAQYDGDRLTEELICYNLWGTNEAGSWEHRAYRYNGQGDCILRVVTTEDGITVSCYEYDPSGHKVNEYIYRVKENWELPCDDGSVWYFQTGWSSPGVKKIAADGKVERELFYGRVMDMGQEAYLMPEDVEETVNDHKYVVESGDCLWEIAKKCYGDSARHDLIYRVNRNVIGADENRILPGMRLYVLEAGNEEDTKKSY